LTAFALAATGEISEMLTTAAREIATAVHASRVITALWSSDDNPAITGWPRAAPGQGASAAAVTVAEHAKDHPDDVADHVMSAMTPAAGYDDDVAVLIYRHPPAPLAVQVTADDPSCLALLRAKLRQWLPTAGIGTREATDIMIAAGEAAANAVEHATAGRPADAASVQITLTARAAHATVQLTITDTGTWRPPPADREQPAPGTRGHGIIFMHALMNEVTIDPSPHGTTVTLTKDLNP
jgi:anti-sigma regulatory factor (Ser/Thr protein kinase)